MTLFASIIPYGITDTDLTSGFCTLLANPMGQVYHVLSIFTICLAFAGLLTSAYKVQMGGDLSSLGTQLVMTVLVSVIIDGEFLPSWILDGEIALGTELTSALGVDPKQVLLDLTTEVGWATLDSVPEDIAIMIAAGFWGIGVGFIALTIVSLAMIALAWILVAVCWGGVIVAYLVQIACIYIAIAMSPIFLGMLLFDKTRETGFKYFMGVVGILFWPLGWDLGFIVMDATIAPLHHLLYQDGTTTAILQAINVLLSGVIAAGLALLETGFMFAILTKAPGIISQAITTGGQVGTGLISAGASGGASAMGTAASAAGGAGQLAGAGGGAFSIKGRGGKK